MRRARQDERAALAALMFDQFYEKEELQQQFSGVDEQTARRFGPAVLSLGQGYYFARGDVFVCEGADGTPIGAIVGVDPRRLSAAVGQKRGNLEALRQMGFEVEIRPEASLSGGTYRIRETGR